jgi:hypothetical protein
MWNMKLPYSCPHCDQKSTRRWNLEIHIKRRHSGAARRWSFGMLNVCDEPPAVGTLAWSVCPFSVVMDIPTVQAAMVHSQ